MKEINHTDWIQTVKNHILALRDIGQMNISEKVQEIILRILDIPQYTVPLC